MPGPGEPSAPLVFVSSTVEDFRDLRSALRHWLDSLGYRFFMSEYSGSDKVLGPGTYDACFEAIGRADLYVLLIGTRRGSLISKEPKRSITEAEYDVAYQLRQETGRPMLLSFVRDEVARDIRRGNPELEYQDIEHTRSFIDKVERTAETNAALEGKGDPPADNWLHRFREFADIATEIDSALGITGSVREARQRDLLREELAEVLQTFVGAQDASLQQYLDANPEVCKQIEKATGKSMSDLLPNKDVRLPTIRHRIADGAFEPLIDRSADQAGTVTVTERRAGDRILSFTMVAGSFSAIEFPRLEEVSRSGAFRRYDAQTRATEITDLQQAAENARRDLRIVRSWAQDFDDAQVRVIASLTPLLQGKTCGCELSRWDVLRLAALYNKTHNAFTRLVALLGALQGTHRSPLPQNEELRSHSPLPGMDEEIARERATPEEVLAWVGAGMFGTPTGK